MHMTLHTGSGFTCDVCGKRCMSRRVLKVHQKSHSSEKEAVCTICGTGFKHKYHLSRHMLLHQAAASGGKQKWGCEQCGKEFAMERVSH